MQDALLNTILGFGFTIVTTMLGWCIAEVRSAKKKFTDESKLLRSELLRIVEKEKSESIIAQRRIDILDGTVSDITEERLNSRNIVEKGSSAPRIHSKLMKFIHGLQA